MEDAADLIGYTIDKRTEEDLLLCVTKAATESITLADYITACDTILGEPPQQSSALIPSLECIHSIAVRSTIQQATACETTEDLCKIAMEVEKKTDFTRMAVATTNLTSEEAQRVLAKASLSPAAIDVTAGEATSWPFATQAQKASSFAMNTTPQAWRVPFHRESGDPCLLYSVVAPGTESHTVTILQLNRFNVVQNVESYKFDVCV